jgi:hypothetical protein
VTLGRRHKEDAASLAICSVTPSKAGGPEAVGSRTREGGRAHREPDRPAWGSENKGTQPSLARSECLTWSLIPLEARLHQGGRRAPATPLVADWFLQSPLDRALRREVSSSLVVGLERAVSHGAA